MVVNTTATVLTDYHEFSGISPDTGTLRNVLAYQGFQMPHTGKVISEALLFGVSGGVVAMYFIFEHPGYDPQFHFVTRNSFDPFDKILSRLGIVTQIKQTDKPEKAHENLLTALAAGKPVIVIADMIQLNDPDGKPQEDNWTQIPFVVYGVDAENAHIADRAQVGYTVPLQNLKAARGRIKTVKHRQITLENPEVSTLASAVEAGIQECISGLSGNAPVKPLQGKYGLDAYSKWAELLVDTKAKEGWAKKFADPQRLVAALLSFYEYTNAMFSGENASRGMYADFLDEAAVLLNKPALKNAAEQWRTAAKAWQVLYDGLLPKSIPVLQELRGLIDRDYTLFITQGKASAAERQQIQQQKRALQAELAVNFPYNDAEIAAWRQHLRDQVLKVRETEAQALELMKAAMA